jgi:hypothetical protein
MGGIAMKSGEKWICSARHAFSSFYAWIGLIAGAFALARFGTDLFTLELNAVGRQLLEFYLAISRGAFDLALGWAQIEVPTLIKDLTVLWFVAVSLTYRTLVRVLVAAQEIRCFYQSKSMFPQNAPTRFAVLAPLRTLFDRFDQLDGAPLFYNSVVLMFLCIFVWPIFILYFWRRPYFVESWDDTEADHPSWFNLYPEALATDFYLRKTYFNARLVFLLQLAAMMLAATAFLVIGAHTI